MRVAIATWGSMGDMVPFMALALKLKQQGCHVTVCAANYFADLVESKGLAYQRIGRKISSQEYNGFMAEVVAEPNPRKQLRLLLQRALIYDLEDQYRHCLEVVNDVDLMVSHWMQMAGIMAAENAKKPLATVTLNPVGLENIFSQTTVASSNTTEDRGNVGLMLSDFIWGEDINTFRSKVGLPKVDSITLSQYSKHMNLVAVSSHLLSDQTMLPANHHVAGFWNLDEHRNWEPEPELQEFLASGPRPIVISFGSMVDGTASETTKLLVEAVKISGHRAIIQMGWGGLGDLKLPKDIYKAQYAPHQFLFAHANCVVHHGGAGTIAAALRCGVPSVVVWHMFDQHFWGSRLESLELGPSPISRLNLSATGLAEKIEEAVDTAAYRENCRKMAVKLDEEPGVQRAAEVLYEAFAGEVVR